MTSRPHPSMHSQIAIRPMQPSDISAVLAIAAIVPTAPHWPPAEYTRMLAVIAEAPARRGAWVAELHRPANPDTQPKSEPASQPCVQGFAMATHVAGTAELEAVVTAPGSRRRGIGSALLTTVQTWARSAGAARLLLEVRASNTDALRLYTPARLPARWLPPGLLPQPQRRRRPVEPAVRRLTPALPRPHPQPPAPL